MHTQNTIPTIKELSPKIAAIPYEKNKWGGGKYLTRKDASEIAARFKGFCQFTDSILNDFQNSIIYYSNGFLNFNYEKGQAKIALDTYEYAVLMPAIEDIAAKYGKQIIND